MKTQLLLIYLFSFILCSPFLRKLDTEVTEASCKNQGKKYQEAIAAQCKIANIVLENISKESDCVKGIWTQKTKAECTATEITSETDCKGIPTFTPSDKKTSATCMINNQNLSDRLESSTACQVALFWTKGKCTKTSQTTQNECTGTWEETITQESEERRLDEKSGTCTIITETDLSDECSGGSYVEGSCSAGGFSKDKCEGTPVYTEGETIGTCKKGEITLNNRETKLKCEVELKWITGSCNYDKLLTQEECESKPVFSDATPAKCIDEEKSSSNFIKAINFALLIICLLIL